MTKGRLTIRIIAGGYLAYVGFGLARDVIAEKPENYLVYLLFGALFMAVGGTCSRSEERRVGKEC